MLVLLLLILISAFTLCRTDVPCVGRDYGYGSIVCVCNSSYCDTIETPERVEAPQSLIYTSSKAGLRFQKTAGTFIASNESIANKIIIGSETTNQPILGFGGAFTDSATINIDSLSEGARNNLLNSYFSQKGIEYSLCRVPLGSTDFSTRSYTYNDGDEDPQLLNFQLADEDFRYKIPVITKAVNLSDGNLQLIASAWTAPKWMKSNGAYSGFGHLKEDMYQSWANYLVKSLDSYKENGIKFWGLTTGNEPSLATIFFFTGINSVGWSSSGMGKWILENLGPAVRSSNHSEMKIIALDDQRFFLPWFLDLALSDDTARSYVDGISVHWYFDNYIPTDVLTTTHKTYPEKFILSAEAAYGVQFGVGAVVLGSWDRGEGYAASIIEDLNHYVTAWIDWNLVLDVSGGPSYMNSCDSPVIVNVTADEFYKQPMYYNLGHFSKFIPRGSVSITSSSFDSDVLVAAFRRSDNSTAAIILNKKEEAVAASIVDSSRGVLQLQVEKKSISTVIYW